MAYKIYENTWTPVDGIPNSRAWIMFHRRTTANVIATTSDMDLAKRFYRTAMRTLGLTGTERGMDMERIRSKTERVIGAVIKEAWGTAKGWCAIRTMQNMKVYHFASLNNQHTNTVESLNLNIFPHPKTKLTLVTVAAPKVHIRWCSINL